MFDQRQQGRTHQGRDSLGQFEALVISGGNLVVNRHGAILVLHGILDRGSPQIFLQTQANIIENSDTYLHLLVFPLHRPLAP